MVPVDLMKTDERVIIDRHAVVWTEDHVGSKIILTCVIPFGAHRWCNFESFAWRWRRELKFFLLLQLWPLRK